MGYCRRWKGRHWGYCLCRRCWARLGLRRRHGVTLRGHCAGWWHCGRWRGRRLSARFLGAPWTCGLLQLSLALEDAWMASPLLALGRAQVAGWWLGLNTLRMLSVTLRTSPLRSTAAQSSIRASAEALLLPLCSALARSGRNLVALRFWVLQGSRW